MEGWVKWLGEMVWRIAKVPSGIRDNQDDKDFWFRSYGVAILVLSLVVGMAIVTGNPEPFSHLLATVSNYTGPDKLLLQGYAGAGLILAVAVPILLISILTFVALLALSAGLGIWIVRRVFMSESTRMARYLETKRHGKTPRP